MKYDFLIEAYESERIKVLSVWSEFKDEDLPVRPLRGDPRGRSVHEQMVPDRQHYARPGVAFNLHGITFIMNDACGPTRQLSAAALAHRLPFPQ
jgi:hypothetical protein